MYGVDVTKPGGQAYYASIFALYASWGVDCIKVDDISRPYDAVQRAEIEAIRQAIDKTWAADAVAGPDRFVGLFNAQSKGENLDLSSADYVSRVISGEGGPQEISVPLAGSKRLVLFVKDDGNGSDRDHVAWVNPVLRGSKGVLKLTDLKWVHAESGGAKCAWTAPSMTGCLP